MADQTIEISNVMGSRGVASEATLLLLLDEFKKREGGTTSRDRTVDLFNRSASSASRSFDNTGDAADGLGKRFLDTAKVFASGARRTEDFVKALAGGEGRLSSLAGYLDNTIDTFRRLSSVGAGFNNSMFDMISASANSAMEMNDFAQFVGTNSQTIRLLGGTVTEGAKALGEFSKELRNSPAGTQLMNMGFTIEDLNEGLVNYTDLQFRLGRGDTLRTKNLAVATAEYLEEVDAIAKATGKSREEIMNLGKEIAGDARVRALQSRLGEEASSRLSQNLTLAAGAIPGLTESFFNMASGTPIDDFSKLLISSVGPAGAALNELMQRADNMDPASFTAEFSRLMPQIGDALSRMDPQQLAALGEFGSGLAGRLPDLARMGDQMDRTAMMSMQRAQEEASRQSRITGIFANFENAIISARRFLVDTFLDSALATALSNMGEKLFDLFSENGTGGIGWGLNLLGNAFNSLAGPNGILTSMVNWMSTELDEGGALYDAYVWLTNKIAEVGTAIGSWWNNFTANIQSEGLWGAVKIELEKFAGQLQTWYTDLFNNQNGSSTASVVSDWFRNIFERVNTMLFGGPDLNVRRQLESEIETAREELRIASAAGSPSEGPARQAAERLALLEAQLNDIPETQGMFSNFTNRLTDFLYGSIPTGNNEELRESLDSYQAQRAELIQGINTDERDLEHWRSVLERTRLTNNRQEQRKAEFFIGIIEGNLENRERLLSEVDQNISGYETAINQIDSGTETEIQGFIPRMLDKMKTLMFGNEVTTTDAFGDQITKREGGILQSIIQGFSDLFDRQEITTALSEAITKIFESTTTGLSEFWNGETGTKLQNDIRSFFRDLIATMEAAFVNSFLARTILGIDRQEVAIKSATEDTSTLSSSEIQNLATVIAERTNTPLMETYTSNLGSGEEQRELFLSSLSDDTSAYLRDAIDNGPWYKTSGAVFKDAISDLAETIRSGQGTTQDITRLQELYRSLASFGELEVPTFGESLRGESRLTDTVTVELDQRGANADLMELAGDLFRQYQGTEGFEDRSTLVDVIGRSIGDAIANTGFNEDERKGLLERWATEIVPHLAAQSLQFNQGTKGFEDFGKGRLAMLHGREAVIPENSPEGKLLLNGNQYISNVTQPKDKVDTNQSLQGIIGNISNIIQSNGVSNLSNEIKTLASAIQAFESKPSPVSQPVNQTALINKIDELNTTMKHVVELLDSGVDVQRKTMKGIRSLGTDFYRGGIG